MEPRTNARTRGAVEQACAELICLASEKLGRPLTHAEQQLIRGLNRGINKRLLAEGYYAELYRGYSQGELLDWFKSVARTNKEFDEIRRRTDAITASEVEQACAEVVRIATEKLGRTLSHGEQKVIRGFDKWLLAEGDVADTYRGYSPQELLDSLNRAGAGPGPVTLLRSLATARCNLKLGRGRIIEYLAPQDRRALAGVDFTPTLDGLSRWFLDILRADPPGRKIRALYFGLMETNDGCMLHVSGANAYDAENSDWACTSDWLPDKRCAPLDQLSEIWKRLRKTSDEPWVVVQAIACIIVRAFFAKHHTDFTKITGLKEIYVASGFDDGDLYTLRTPLSPKA